MADVSMEEIITLSFKSVLMVHMYSHTHMHYRIASLEMLCVVEN